MQGTSELLPVILIAFALWLIGLSGFVYWIYKRFKALGKGVKTGNLIKTLDSVLQAEQNNTELIEELDKQLSDQVKRSEQFIQNIGFVRFNPFNETGGDHSFAIAVLDKHSDGFIITSLHSRDRTRVYAKEIKNGKSKYDLSNEEQKALKKAQK